jgi:hypothetical protein
MLRPKSLRHGFVRNGIDLRQQQHPPRDHLPQPGDGGPPKGPKSIGTESPQLDWRSAVRP